MVLECNVPRELKDSVVEVLGASRTPRISRLVQLEIKTDRPDTRILVLTDHRLLIFSTKVPVKLEQNVHFLEITSIESSAHNRLLVQTDTKRLSINTAGKDEANALILHIGKALHSSFPGVNIQDLIRTFHILDTDRMLQLLDELNELTRRLQAGPCEGFSAAYRCMCDFYNQPCQEDVVWDVDTIYLSHDTRQLCLADFDHLDNKHLLPILAALLHNKWFTSLHASNIKLSVDAATEIIRVLKTNTTLEELHLANTGIKSDFAQKLATAVISNDKSQLRVLDLSGNVLEDKGIVHLCGLSKQLQHLTSLHLHQVALSTKGLNRLADSLAQNSYVSSTLTCLNVSSNLFKSDDITAFCQFLSTPNALTELNLSGTECALDSLFGALLRGCTQHLCRLDLRGTVFSYKRSRDVTVPQTWKHFFSSALALQHVCLAECRSLPAEAVKSLLLGISSNPACPQVRLDISSCSLGAVGTQVLEVCIVDLQNIVELNISDNGIDADMSHLVTKVALNRCIRKLHIGANFSNIKSKHLSSVLDSIVRLMQDENTVLNSLSVADSRLRGDTSILINALGANASLTEIDISGNQMGDVGARMLAKALQLNNKLQTVYWDNNNTSSQGFVDIANSIDKNFMLRQMPTPLVDAQQAMKMNPERTQHALKKIESLLQRNHSPRKFLSEPSYRLQQSFLLSSSQQMVDRLTMQIEHQLAGTTDGPTSEQQRLLDDAEQCRHLLPTFQQKSLQSGDPAADILLEMSEKLQTVIETAVQKNVSTLLKCAEEKCPTVLKDKAFADEVQHGCQERAPIPADFTRALLTEQVATDTTNKISEITLAVAAYLSDKLTDRVLDSLDKMRKNISRVQGESELDREARHSILRTKSNESLGDSPKLSKKRKSLQTRRLRPQSTINGEVILEVEDYSDNRSEDSLDTTDWTDASTGDSLLDSRESTPSSELNRSRTGDELPSLDSSAPKLQHLGKNRPKRTKNRAVSRAIIHSDVPDDDHVFSDSSGSGSKSGTVNGNAEAVVAVREDSRQEAKKNSKSLAANLTGFFRKKSSPEASKTFEVPEPEKRSPEPKAEESTKVEEPTPEATSPSGVRLPPGARGMPGMGLMSELKHRQRSSVIQKPAEVEEETKEVSPGKYGSSRPQALYPRNQRNVSAATKPPPPLKPRPILRPKPKPGDPPARESTYEPDAAVKKTAARESTYDSANKDAAVKKTTVRESTYDSAYKDAAVKKTAARESTYDSANKDTAVKKPTVRESTYDSAYKDAVVKKTTMRESTIRESTYDSANKDAAVKKPTMRESTYDSANKDAAVKKTAKRESMYDSANKEAAVKKTAKDLMPKEAAKETEVKESSESSSRVPGSGESTPREPAIKRTPRSNKASGQMSDPEDDDGTTGDTKESPSPGTTTVKKRGSVRERARFLDKNSNVDAPPSAVPSDNIMRSRTLPNVERSVRSTTRAKSMIATCDTDDTTENNTIVFL